MAGLQVSYDDRELVVTIAESFSTNAGTGGLNRGQVEQIVETAVDAEEALRVSGDDLQSIVVASHASYRAALAAQIDADTPLIVLFSAQVIDGSDLYKKNDVVYFPPRSASPERLPSVSGDPAFDFVASVSPGVIDKNNIPSRYNFWLSNEVGANESATQVRVTFLGRSVTFPNYNPALRQVSIRWAVTDADRVAIAALTEGHSQVAAVALQDSAGNGVDEFGVDLTVVEGATGQGQGGTTDNTARAAAAAAAKAAADNRTAIAAINARHYPAELTVWPPNVAQHSAIQRNFKAVLNSLREDVLRLDGGSTGTRFVNRFQIKTRNADRAEVLLHDQAWSYTEEGAQELEWEVSAAEFNQLGTSVSTDYIEVWGEFRAVYGGGVNEVRGRTNTFVIGFGDEDDWPATREDVAHERRGRENDDQALDKRITDLTARVSTNETDITALEAGELTTVGKIALLSLTSEPTGVAFKTDDELAAALRRTVVRISNPELLDGDVWVEGQVVGQPALARTKWSSATSALNLDLSQNVAQSVSNNIATDTDYAADLAFFAQANGGSEIERLQVRITLTDLRDLATAESDIDTLEDKVEDLETPQLNALTSGAAVAWNVDNGNIGTMTAAHNFTLNISGGANGEFAVLRTLQDTTGSRTMTLHNSIALDGRDSPVLSTAAGAHDTTLFMKRGTVWVYLGIIKNG